MSYVHRISFFFSLNILNIYVSQFASCLSYLQSLTYTPQFYVIINVQLLCSHAALFKLFPSSFEKGNLVTVGPRLSGHQLSGYLYYPAMILQYIVFCLYCLFSTTVLLKTKTKQPNICFILLSNPFYMSDNLLQMEQQ